MESKKIGEDMNEALKMAMDVDFLTSGTEIRMYAEAVYAAIKWGKNI